MTLSFGNIKVGTGSKPRTAIRGSSEPPGSVKKEKEPTISESGSPRREKAERKKMRKPKRASSVMRKKCVGDAQKPTSSSVMRIREIQKAERKMRSPRGPKSKAKVRKGGKPTIQSEGSKSQKAERKMRSPRDPKSKAKERKGGKPTNFISRESVSMFFRNPVKRKKDDVLPQSSQRDPKAKKRKERCAVQGIQKVKPKREKAENPQSSQRDPKAKKRKERCTVQGIQKVKPKREKAENQRTSSVERVCRCSSAIQSTSRATNSHDPKIKPRREKAERKMRKPTSSSVEGHQGRVKTVTVNKKEKGPCSSAIQSTSRIQKNKKGHVLPQSSQRVESKKIKRLNTTKISGQERTSRSNVVLNRPQK
uniref:uncharacterized protein DDB_G0286299-like n=1 Tax=Styela clava TaxID=7725 RepID=UPI001939FE63|nr:uncharacterized protein DDB_G0286299-like [Styela clava]